MNIARLCIALLLVAGTANGAVRTGRISGDSSFSSDSDGLHERKADLGYESPSIGLGSDAVSGVRAGYWLLSDPSDRIEFGTLGLQHRERVGPVDVKAYLSQLWSDGWSPTLGGFYFDYHATSRWSIEGSGDYQLVDTVTSVRRHIRFSSYSLVTDYRLLDSVTVVGGLLHDWFSDGNHRIGGIARVIYSPSALPGFNVQIRYRRLDTQFRGVGYFSPKRWEDTLGLLQYRRPVFGNRFVVTAIAGGGIQIIDGSDSSSIYRAEVRARGWFNDHFGLQTKLGCTNTGGINVRAASGGYRYCYGGLSLIGSL